MDTEKLSREFEDALLTLDESAARNLIHKALEALTPVRVSDDILSPALERIGKGWEEGSLALSQVYMGGRMCEIVVDSFFSFSKPVHRRHGPMAIAVLNDYHVLGKRIVSSLLRVAGYDLLDYGTADVNTLLRRIEQDSIDIMFISTLMFPSALKVKELTTRLHQEASAVKVVVGGAPFRFDQQLWKEVGADAMGMNAGDAIRIASEMGVKS